MARDSQEWRGRETAFDVSAGLDLQLDLLTKAGVEAAKGKVQALLDAGVTHLNAAFAAQSLQHHLDQMDAFQEQVVPAFA